MFVDFDKAIYASNFETRRRDDVMATFRIFSEFPNLNYPLDINLSIVSNKSSTLDWHRVGCCKAPINVIPFR